MAEIYSNISRAAGFRGAVRFQGNIVVSHPCRISNDLAIGARGDIIIAMNVIKIFTMP